MMEHVILARKVLFVLACLAVTVLSLLPGEALPPLAFNVWDKTQHLGAFAALALLGLWAFPQRPLALLLTLLVYGVLIELAQAATGWRYGDWQDWLADALGVVLGFVLWRGYCIAAAGIQSASHT